MLDRLTILCRNKLISIILFIFTLLFCVVFAYWLIHPATGIGIYDFTFIPFQYRDYAGYILCLQYLIPLSIVLHWPAILQSHIGLRWPVILLAAVMLLLTSAVFISDIAAIPVITADILLGFCIFFLCCLWLMKNQYQRSILVITLGMVFIYYGICILMHMFGVTSDLTPGLVFRFTDIYRLSIVFDNPNHLGNLLAFGVIMCFASTLGIRRWPFLVGLWGLMAVLAYGLIATLSRGAWSGCLVGFLTTAIYGWHCPTTRRQTIPSCIAAILLFLLLAVAYDANLAKQRIVDSHPTHDAAIHNRLLVWHGALRMIADHPWMGVGIGQFGTVLESRKYKPAAIAHLYYESAINNYLTLAAETGIPTLVLYLLAVILVCVEASKHVQRCRGPYAGLYIGMLCGVYSLLMFGMTTYSLGRVYANVLMWSTLGCLVALPEPSSTKSSSSMQPQDKSSVLMPE